MSFVWSVIGVALSPTVVKAQDSAPALRTQDPDSRAAERKALPADEQVPTKSSSDLLAGPTARVWTLAELESMALAQHPSMAEAAAVLDSLAGKHLQAGLRPNPYFGYSGQQLFSNGEAEQQGIVLGQTLVRPVKLDLDQAVVCREIDEASESLAIRQQQVRTDVRLAFYAILIAQQRRKMTGDLLAIARKNLATVETLERAEEASRVDRLRADLEVQRAIVQSTGADNLWRAAWQTMAAVIGHPELERGEIAEESFDGVGEFDERLLFEQLKSASPELRQALARRERAAAVLQRAQVESLPDLNVEAVVQADNATGNANANFQVTFPVPVRNRNQGGIRQAEGELAAADQAIHRLELELNRRLADVLVRFQNAVAMTSQSTAEHGILAAAQQSLDLVETAYKAGEVNYLELLTAQRVLAEAKLQHLDAQADYWASRCEIEGLLLSGSLSDFGGTIPRDD